MFSLSVSFVVPLWSVTSLIN